MCEKRFRQQRLEIHQTSHTYHLRVLTLYNIFSCRFHSTTWPVHRARSAQSFQRRQMDLKVASNLLPHNLLPTSRLTALPCSCKLNFAMEPMLLPQYSATQRLRTYCRKLESICQPCLVVSKHMNVTKHHSSITATLFSSSTGVPNNDHELLISSKTHPSSLCDGCSAYNIINVFRTSRPET